MVSAKKLSMGQGSIMREDTDRKKVKRGRNEKEFPQQVGWVHVQSGLCIPVATGQTVTGSITGEITDPSGAVVSGAQVVAHNLATGVDSPATTNSAGLYRIDFLPIGHYQVTCR